MAYPWGGIMMIHVGRGLAMLHVDGNGKAEITTGEVVYSVDRSAGEVLHLAPASLRLVDEWLRRVRGPNWSEAAHVEAQALARKKRKQWLREYIAGHAEESRARLRARYGTVSGQSGTYGRAPYFKGSRQDYDPETGEVYGAENSGDFGRTYCEE